MVDVPAKAKTVEITDKGEAEELIKADNFDEITTNQYIFFTMAHVDSENFLEYDESVIENSTYDYSDFVLNNKEYA